MTDDAAKRGQFKGFYKKTVFYEAPLSDKEVARIKGMVDIRNAYQEVIAIQRYYDYDKETFNHLLGKLNRTYDSFVKHYGYLNSAVNRNLFDSDDKYSLLASLEDESLDPSGKSVIYTKSLAFEKALVRPEKEVKKVHTTLDALNSSLADGRGVDFDYMMSIYQVESKMTLIEELGDLIMPDPEKYLNGELTYVSRQDFLSGDVVTKLEVVDLFVKQDNQDFNWSHYAGLLETVKPARITLADMLEQSKGFLTNIQTVKIPNDCQGVFFVQDSMKHIDELSPLAKHNLKKVVNRNAYLPDSDKIELSKEIENTNKDQSQELDKDVPEKNEVTVKMFQFAKSINRLLSGNQLQKKRNLDKLIKILYNRN